MTNSAKLDILCLSGQDESTTLIKQSDLLILKNELGSKKVEINIIDDINDLTFKNPILIHDFSDCLNNPKKLQTFFSKYFIMRYKLGSKKVEINIIDDINELTFKNPILIHDFSNCLNNPKKLQTFLSKYFIMRYKLSDGSSTEVDNKITTLWNAIIPRLCLEPFKIRKDMDTTLDTLIKVRKFKTPFMKMLEMGIISYALNKKNIIELIQNFMKSKQTKKAYVRFGHGNNPSFLVDIDKPDSFNIDFDKYTGNRLSLSTIVVHPIKSDVLCMKGVISMIFIEGKYSHAVIKKPYNLDTGIRTYKIMKHSPDYSLLRSAKTIVNLMNCNGTKLPIIQINLCYGHDPVYQYLLTKINYIDPKLYLNINKRHAKKVRKLLMGRIKDYNTISPKLQKMIINKEIHNKKDNISTIIIEDQSLD